jgi:capsular polysaccharide biosynthesis protein
VNDDTVRLSMVGQVFRRRWQLLIVFAIAGAIVGAGASSVLSPGYQTSADVLLQGSHQADELTTETTVATSSTVLDRTAKALRWGVTGTELADSVAASVLDGNVIAITARADSPEKAKKLADRMAREYVAFSTELAAQQTDASTSLAKDQQDALRDQIEQTNDMISQLSRRANGDNVESVQVRTQLQEVRSSLTEAMTTLAESESSSIRSNLVVMGSAELPTAKAAPTLTQLVIGGALVGILVGVFAHLISASRRRRVYADSDIASALGANILGTVTVPHEHARNPGEADRPHLVALGRQLLGLDRPWFVEQLPDAGDERDQAVRYRRLVHRLHETAGTPLHILAVVADDDPEALSGVARLAAETGSAGEPTEVITDIPGFANVVEQLDAGPSRPVVRERAETTPAGNRTILRLVEVSAELPTVPEPADEAGVVLVTTAGTRTDWQLDGLTQACVDAGYPVLGAMIVHRSRPAAAPAGPAAPPASVSDDALAGAR